MNLNKHRFSNTRLWLLILIAAGAMIRLIFAKAYPKSHIWDDQHFAVWMNSTLTSGVTRVYDTVGADLNYPPLTLILFYAIKLISNFLPDSLKPDDVILIKLVPITTDLLVSGLLFRIFGLCVGPSGTPATAKYGLLVTAIWLFNPAVIYDSAYWGQMDSVLTLWIVAGLIALSQGAWSLAGLLLGLAMLAKLQAVVAVPAFAYIAYKASYRALLRLICSACAIWLAVILPFLIKNDPTLVLAPYFGAVGHHPSITVNSYNIWRLYNSIVSMVSSNPPALMPKDSEALFGALTYRQAGIIMFASIVMLSLLAYTQSWRTFLHQNRRPPRLAEAMQITGILFMAFYEFPTQIHERYGMPALAFLTVWAVQKFNPNLFLYAILSLTFGINLYHVNPLEELPKWVPWWRISQVCALLNLIVLGTILVLFWRRSNTRAIAQTETATIAN